MKYQRTQISPQKLSTQIKYWVYLTCIVGWFFLWIRWAWDIPVNIENKLHITNKTTLSNLHTSLNVNISDTRYRLWRIFFSPDIKQLKAGIFIVPKETNTLEKIFLMLENPTPSEEEITILPGWHLWEVSEAFKKNLFSGDLVADQEKLIAEFSPAFPFLQGKTSLEGFLMPDTYRFIWGSPISTIVERMLENFNKKIYQPYLESGRPDTLFYDVLILASIVGEEEKSASQIGIVADILKKRLRKWWHIGADITVCYAELIPWNECQKYVNNFYSSSLSARVEKNNLYDTRSKLGLPPTPISGVTANTFLVTMNSEANTEAWYYLHDSSGVIRTAITNAEHEANKAQYLR